MYNISSKSHTDKLGNLFMDVCFQDDVTKEVIEKRLDVKDYVRLFEQNIQAPETMIAVPILPKEVIACRMSTTNKNSFDAVVLCKAQKRAFLFHGMHYYIPFPTLIARISVRGGVKQSMNLYALATDEPTEDTPLMHYPFGNVNGSGGTCFGNIVVENIMDVTQVMEVLDAFLCGETNGDLYHSQNAKHLKQGELVEEISKKEVFPTDLLLRFPDKTVGDLCGKKEKEEVAY